ncbi:MAG: hypothetical protein R2774_03690 [Saprospiraceae bacterium]
MEDKVHQVIENIKRLRCKSEDAREIKENLIIMANMKKGCSIKRTGTGGLLLDQAQ